MPPPTGLVINAGVTVNAGVTLNGFAPTAGGGRTLTTYDANGTGYNTDFTVFPTDDIWGMYYHYYQGYLEITQSAWTNTTAFNNLLNGTITRFDPAGFGFLVNFPPNNGWQPADTGVYRMPINLNGIIEQDNGICRVEFTYGTGSAAGTSFAQSGNWTSASWSDQGDYKLQLTLTSSPDASLLTALNALAPGDSIGWTSPTGNPTSGSVTVVGISGRLYSGGSVVSITTQMPDFSLYSEPYYPIDSITI
jgi:hypothetical protein